MIQITETIALDEGEFALSFVRASGPGGQNVNKVSSAVQLRFDVAGSARLDEPLRRRLARLAGRRMTRDGVLVIDARRYRSQERNRQDAIDRLVALIRKAAEPPRPRRKTAPSRAARERRLVEKRQRGESKRRRLGVSASED